MSRGLRDRRSEPYRHRGPEGMGSKQWIDSLGDGGGGVKPEREPVARSISEGPVFDPEISGESFIKF